MNVRNDSVVALYGSFVGSRGWMLVSCYSLYHRSGKRVRVLVLMCGYGYGYGKKTGPGYGGTWNHKPGGSLDN